MAKRYLLVGDPHVTPDSLDDCRALIDHICDVMCREGGVDRVVFLGDLHHTHSIVHADVLSFWLKSLRRIASLSNDGAAVCLVGNHDKSTDKNTPCHALEAYSSVALIVDCPLFIEGNVLCVPYLHDPSGLADTVRAVACSGKKPLLLCHQTFDGSVYENGFYASDGIDHSDIEASLIISGHIHKPQRFGNVWYPGSPRWRTLSDANESRCVWVVDVNNGVVTAQRPYSTDGICSAVLRSTYRDGVLIDGPDPFLATSRRWSMWHFDVHGDSFLSKGLLGQLSAIERSRVRFHETSVAVPPVRESDGVMVAFGRYLESFDSVKHHGTPVSVLRKMVWERMGYE